MIEFKVTSITGKKAIINKLNNINKFTPNSLQHALQYGGTLLKDRAKLNLQNLAKFPGMSVDGESILDDKTWDIVPVSQKEVRVECNSKHALIVEFGGGGGIIHSHSYGHYGWPIGRQQGMAITDNKKMSGKGGTLYRKTVKLQRGYHYFQSAKDSQWVQESITNRIKRDLWKSIRSCL